MRCLLFLLLASACASLQPIPTNDKVPDMIARTLKLDVSCEDPTQDTGGSAVRLGHHMVLTAKHITNGRETCKFTGTDASDKEIDLTFEKQSGAYDVGLLSEQEDLPPALLVVPGLGEAVWAVGYPAIPGTLTQELSVTFGTVAGAADSDGEVRITNSIYYGSSGGGAWNQSGQLLGITVSFRSGAAGYSYIVGVDALRQFLGNDIEEAP